MISLDITAWLNTLTLVSQAVGGHNFSLQSPTLLTPIGRVPSQRSTSNVERTAYSTAAHRGCTPRIHLQQPSRYVIYIYVWTYRRQPASTNFSWCLDESLRGLSIQKGCLRQLCPCQLSPVGAFLDLQSSQKDC